MKRRIFIVLCAAIALNSPVWTPSRAGAQERPIVPRQPFVVYKVDITDFSGKSDIPIKDFPEKPPADDYTAMRRHAEANWQRWNYIALERRKVAQPTCRRLALPTRFSLSCAPTNNPTQVGLLAGLSGRDDHGQYHATATPLSAAAPSPDHSPSRSAG